MRHVIDLFFRITSFVLIMIFWLWLIDQRLSVIMDTLVIVGGLLLIFPIAWLGRKMIDKEPTIGRVARITTLVHYTVVVLLGAGVVRAIKTQQDWSGWSIPVPTGIGLFLVIVTGAAALLSVLNLALKGFGAPFAVALSQKLAVDWLYAWTRNPMVLSTVAFGLSLGIWFQSTLFFLWILVLFAPALLFFVKVYEERELEIRFGAAYLEYKSRTPMLLPRKPAR